MARLKIKDAPLLTNVIGTEKIPTGSRGDFTITPDLLVQHFINKIPFVTQSQLASVKAELESKINTVETTLSQSISALADRVSTVETAMLGFTQDLTLHIADQNNPHKVTKQQIGLGSVDNTSDINKPVSNAVALELSLKANYVDVYNKNDGVPTNKVFDSSGLSQDTINNNLRQDINKLLNLVVTPEMFGAVGNGTTDDTIAVRSWWLSPFKRKEARNKYSVNLGVNGAVFPLENDLSVDMLGSTFIAQAEAKYMFMITVNSNIKYNVVLNGGTIDSNNFVARPLEINGDGRLSQLTIQRNIGINIKENGQVLSAIGCRVDVLCDITIIQQNTYDSVQRTTSSAGTTTSCGISVVKVDSTCIIRDNIVRNIYTVDDVDADGIVVFSVNRLITPSQIQKTNVRVYSNRIENCQGRFIKLQCPAKVYNNDLRSSNVQLITQFRAIDAQHGGVDVYNNEWRIESSVVVGTDATFFVYNGNGANGGSDNVGTCVGNKIYAGVGFRYFASINILGGNHKVSIVDNTIKDEDGLTKVEDFVRFTLPSTVSSFSQASIRVSNNSCSLGTSGVVILSGTAFNDQNVNSKISISITDNNMSNVLNGAKVVEVATGGVPYVGDILIRSNGSNLLSYNQLIVKGIDVLKLRQGNNFYYATDGSTGGMTNTPTGYNRYVFVEIGVGGGIVSLTTVNGSKKAVKGNASWNEYTSTVIS